MGREELRQTQFARDPKKNGRKDNHGQPNTIHAMGVMNPTMQAKTHPLTNKRMEMLKKHPERMLPSEKELLKK